jgi:hypothetical protein
MTAGIPFATATGRLVVVHGRVAGPYCGFRTADGETRQRTVT